MSTDLKEEHSEEEAEAEEAEAEVEEVVQVVTDHLETRIKTHVSKPT